MIEVTCAIITNEEGHVLVTQRSADMKLPLKFEFPGGKIETGESAEQCLLREVKEELNLEIEIVSSLSPVIYHYSEFSIRLIPFVCYIKSGNLILREHASSSWRSIDQSLLDLDWAAADIPIVREFLSTRN
ncbi:(deoxy)nucleoside triphosphate pyrophosphohydrolase [Pedobacter frigoris]|uniref:8-oxo-dGTP diphosphatase n=1 Tax=Pedobacter frigoris TaxID=2571272 RepID=A0A4U1CGQ6_9SPHI|nr:(deoxy)nucleoside triphosphate pyrophosphohydrolase [Pedobacter frigoris]TKC05904.1 (deoxy)nucleoside triphosphate pyrophosphohydrolase [Pedobacter frigoris]